MNTIIWHNPRCSKSRATLALLSEKNISVEERRYLKDIPSKDDLEMVIDYLKDLLELAQGLHRFP